MCIKYKEREREGEEGLNRMIPNDRLTLLLSQDY